MKALLSIGLFIVGISTLQGADSLQPEESSYRNYIQGTLAAGIIQPFNGDTYVNTEKNDLDAVTTLSVDLFLLPKYYGGLYVGYKTILSDTEGADVISVEKRYHNFSFYYKKVSSQEQVTPLFDNDLQFIDGSGNSKFGQSGIEESIPFDQSRYEARYYGAFDTKQDLKDKKFGYVSFFYENTERLLIGRDIDGKLTKDYYVDGNVDIYALAIGVMQRDFELSEGWFATGAFDIGLATMHYTDDVAYGDNGIGESPVLAWGMNFEFGYNFLFADEMQLVFALYGGYTTAGDSMSFSAQEMYSQGDVRARIAYSF
jgi:hypothetical protein